MLRSIYLKTLYNLRWQLLGWSIGIGFVVFLTLALYNSFNQSGIASIIDSVPESLKAFVGTVEDFKTIAGYIGQQIFGPNTYILTIAASILIALNVSANEEDDKRLQTLLTLPVTRSAVFCQKWLAVMTGVAVICAVIVTCIFLALPIIGQSADGSHVLQSALACFLINAAFATMAFSVAMFTGKKGLSIVLASGYAVFCFVISSLTPSVEGLKHLEKLSLLHYYNNPLVMQHGLKASHALILTAIIVIIATISWARFRTRNVGV